MVNIANSMYLLQEIFKCVHDVSQNMIYLDIQKAFEKVPHRRLIHSFVVACTAVGCKCPM